MPEPTLGSLSAERVVLPSPSALSDRISWRLAAPGHVGQHRGPELHHGVPPLVAAEVLAWAKPFGLMGAAVKDPLNSTP